MTVGQLKNQIRKELDTIMQEINSEIQELNKPEENTGHFGYTQECSHQLRFELNRELSNKLKTILEVSEKLENKNLIPRFSKNEKNK